MLRKLTMMLPFLIAALAVTVGMAEAQNSSTMVPNFRFEAPTTPDVQDPNLGGQHFRITALEHPGYVDLLEDPGTGKLAYSGYLIDILEELAKPRRANFTYELVSPSGFGSKCKPRLTLNGTNYTSIAHHPEAYHPRYYRGYVCGESDVNDRPLSEYSTDFFWGLYYITPQRIKLNKFTVAYAPPDRATLGMMGTATNIHNIHDLANNNHKYNYNVCSWNGTAFFQLLILTFPQLDIQEFPIGVDIHALLDDGTCDVFIGSFPILKQRVLALYNDHQCMANGKPIGIIGDPLEYGLNSFAFGIRDDLPDSIVRTLNFWLLALMSCFPDDPNGYCPEGQGSISKLYTLHLGTGMECGYVQFPQPKQKETLPAAAIVAIALTPVLLVVALGMAFHSYRLKQQEKRMKKRFIQQLARNIEIGDSARDISAQKLSEAFQHIGGQDGMISKEDLAKWLNDLHLDFLSEKDFDRLWDTMDMEGTGYVNPVDFSAFLSACEEQFKEVHREWDALPKSEKMKLSMLRLSNIRRMGEEEVLKMQRRHNKRSRLMPPSLESTKSLFGDGLRSSNAS